MSKWLIITISVVSLLAPCGFADTEAETTPDASTVETQSTKKCGRLFPFLAGGALVGTGWIGHYLYLANGVDRLSDRTRQLATLIDSFFQSDGPTFLKNLADPHFLENPNHIGEGIILDIPKIEQRLPKDVLELLHSPSQDGTRDPEWTKKVVDAVTDQYYVPIPDPDMKVERKQRFASDILKGYPECDKVVCRHKAPVVHYVLKHYGIESELIWGWMLDFHGESVFGNHFWVYIPSIDRVADPTNFSSSLDADYYYRAYIKYYKKEGTFIDPRKR